MTSLETHRDIDALSIVDGEDRSIHLHHATREREPARLSGQGGRRTSGRRSGSQLWMLLAVAGSNGQEITGQWSWRRGMEGKLMPPKEFPRMRCALRKPQRKILVFDDRAADAPTVLSKRSCSLALGRYEKVARAITPSGKRRTQYLNLVGYGLRRR